MDNITQKEIAEYTGKEYTDVLAIPANAGIVLFLTSSHVTLFNAINGKLHEIWVKKIID